MITAGYESLQLVAFFAGFPPVSDAASLWTRHFPEPYASFQKPIPVVSIATGAHSGLAYELHLHPSRLDLVVRPEQQDGAPPGAKSKLSDLSGPALAALLPMLQSLTIVRIAAISKHRKPMSDMASAVAYLRKLLPTLPVADGDTDVSFQRSRPTPSKVQGNLQINQLVRLGTGIGMEMMVQFGPNGTPNQMPGTQHVFVEQICDFNTNPQFRPVAQNVPALFAELLSEIEATTAGGLINA